MAVGPFRVGTAAAPGRYLLAATAAGRNAGYRLDVYRFLATPRWLGFAVLTVVMAAVMVELGIWQLHRYQERSRSNAQVAATGRAAPSPLEQVLAAPAPAAGSVGPAPPGSAAWTRVSVTGRYDRSHEILLRGRTVGGNVGYEVVTPLVLADGSAVLVDRGWLPPASGGADAVPVVPAAPDGEVRVTGRLHLPESRAAPVERVDGRLEARRVAPALAAKVVPFPLYGGYVTLQSQEPAADRRFVAVPPPSENALQNGGYVLQWWLFAAITVIGFGYVAHREAHGGFAPGGDRLDDPDTGDVRLWPR